MDFSSWMHMAARSYCEYVVAGDFEAAKREAKAYFDRGLGVLRRAGVGRVHFVRDGAPLPAKANVVAKRELVRAEALKAAAESLANLPPQLQLTVPERKAHLKLCQAAVGRLAWLDDYVGEWLKGLSDGDWVVGVETALFEADPQLVHLFSLGGFSCILAEDQDLFVYGVPVAVLSKLNFKTGTCTFLDLAQVPPSSHSVARWRRPARWGPAPPARPPLASTLPVCLRRACWPAPTTARARRGGG